MFYVYSETEMGEEREKIEKRERETGGVLCAENRFHCSERRDRDRERE